MPGFGIGSLPVPFTALRHHVFVRLALASPHPATSSKHHLFVRLAFGFTSPCYFLKTSSIRSARLRLHLTLLLPQNIIYSFGSPSASPHPATSSKHHLFVRLAFGFTSPCYFLKTSSIRSARLRLHLTL